MQLCRRVLIVGLLFFTMAVHAQSPVNMLQKTVDRFVASLNKNYYAIQKNPKVAHRIVKRILLPKIDMNIMARSVIGRAHWVKASKAQKRRFKREFTSLVLRTYERAFVAHRYERVKVYPMRGNHAGKKRLLIHSTVIRKGAAPVDLSYRMILRGKKWKIYDMSVEGISLIQSYRSQFSGPLGRGGIDNLIKEIRNRKS